MAQRKMTFTIPEDLAALFLHRIPAQDRSRYVAEAISARLREQEKRMIQSCVVANNTADVLAIEQEWDSVTDTVDRIQEPWFAPTR